MRPGSHTARGSPYLRGGHMAEKPGHGAGVCETTCRDQQEQGGRGWLGRATVTGQGPGCERSPIPALACVGNEGTKPRPSAEMGGQVSVRTGEFPESPHLGLGRAIPG